MAPTGQVIPPKESLDVDAATLQAYSSTLSQLGIFELTRASSGTFEEIEVKRRLTEGAWGDINEGTFRRDGEETVVVIKTLRLKGFKYEDAGHRAAAKRMDNRLRREMHSWARLNHHRISPLLAYAFSVGLDSSNGGTDLYLPVLVAPMRGNGSLADYIKAHPDVDKLLLLQQACEGLAYLHGLTPTIVHCDIKPDNILIRDNGEAELCDFGLAKVISEDDAPLANLTSNYRVSSIYYNPPEVVLYDPEEDAEDQDRPRTPAVDVYCAGTTIVHVMSGVSPFFKQRYTQVVKKLMDEDRCPHRREAHPINAPKEAVDALWQLLHRCFAFQPESRPSAAQVVDELCAVRRLT